MQLESAVEPAELGQTRRNTTPCHSLLKFAQLSEFCEKTRATRQVNYSKTLCDMHISEGALKVRRGEQVVGFPEKLASRRESGEAVQRRRRRWTKARKAGRLTLWLALNGNYILLEIYRTCTRNEIIFAN